MTSRVEVDLRLTPPDVAVYAYAIRGIRGEASGFCRLSPWSRGTLQPGSESLKVVDSFPRAVMEIENVWIPMSDGCRLAARIWLPESALSAPVPAIIEYIPYRKRDFTRWRDGPIHHYFAGHGYASLRVDVRGSGDSDGLLLDEYTTQEHSDGLEVIGWAASQPWCDGAVGMIGKSWGGFNSLQIAALRPPQLKAVIAVCATDDRYADDAHYMGGCLLNENLIWGSVLFTLCALPPDPEVVGDRWRSMWRQRLDSLQPFADRWLSHQRRDDYWKHGSVCEDYSRIACAVYAVSGWADGYSNAVPRLLAGLRVPRLGLVGPWGHVYPHEGLPGPAIGFLQEALRWWDHWLKGVDTGIMEEPRYRVWMQEGNPPESPAGDRPGRWVAEEAWPSRRIERRRLSLTGDGGLREEVDIGGAGGHDVRVESPQTVGLHAGSWCGFGMEAEWSTEELEGDFPGHQRPDDESSVTFDTDPLAGRLEILGAPRLVLSLVADRSVGLVAARLNDVAPDGTSVRVTYGVLNLTHRDGHEHPQPLEPGERYDIGLDLNDVAYAFLPGHRLRLALSTSYWPLVWPSPRPVRLTIGTGASYLELPVRPERGEDAGLRPFGEPESAPPPPHSDLDEPTIARSVLPGAAPGEVVYSTRIDVTESGEVVVSRLESIDLEVGHGMTESFRILDTDPLSGRAEVAHRTIARRGAWSVEIETRTVLSATVERFRVKTLIEARENSKVVFQREWDSWVERDLV